MIENLQLDTTPEAPPQTFKPPTNLDNLDPNKWGGEVNPSKLALQMNAENVNQISGIRKEGVKAGNDAANALFAQNTGTISSALTARARKAFARNESQRGITNEMKGFARSRMAIGEAAAQQAQMWKLRRANFAGQLQWADQVANYNQAMETTKLGLLGSIISGGMAVAGFALGGPAGAAAAAGLAGGAKGAMK